MPLGALGVGHSSDTLFAAWCALLQATCLSRVNPCLQPACWGACQQAGGKAGSPQAFERLHRANFKKLVQSKVMLLFCKLSLDAQIPCKPGVHPRPPSRRPKDPQGPQVPPRHLAHPTWNIFLRYRPGGMHSVIECVIEGKALVPTLEIRRVHRPIPPAFRGGSPNV